MQIFFWKLIFKSVVGPTMSQDFFQRDPRSCIYGFIKEHLRMKVDNGTAEKPPAMCNMPLLASPPLPNPCLYTHIYTVLIITTCKQL